MNSELYDAVINDEVDVLKELKGKLSVSDQRTPTDSTVLHLACHYGSINCVKEILNVYEPLRLKLDSRGETALHLAAREGHYDVVETLINKAKSSLVQPNYPINTSSTLIQYVIRLANVEFETALHAAVRYKHNNVVQLLVKEDPIHSHIQNKHDETPLYLACIRGDAQIMNTILDNCESPTSGGPDGRTALHAALLLDDEGFECVKLLLLKNKDLVKIADNYGWTVFHYVAFKDLHTIVDDLIGADKSVAYLADKEYKRTALHVAAEQGNVKVMKQLLKHIPDSLEILDASGPNILHISVEKLDLEVIRLVLSQDPKASKKLLIQRNKDGNTPLHLIALRGFYVPEILNLNELDWEVLNHRNLTPLELIYKKRGGANYSIGDALVTKQLIKANAKQHLHLWHTLKGKNADKEKRTTGARVEEDMNLEQIENYSKDMNSHVIVAALIATQWRTQKIG